MVTKYSQAQKADNAPDLKPLSMMLKGALRCERSMGLTEPQAQLQRS